MPVINKTISRLKCEVHYTETNILNANPIVVERVLYDGEDITDTLGQQCLMWIEEDIFDDLNGI